MITHTHTHVALINNRFFKLLQEAAELVGVKLYSGVEWKKLGDLLDYEQPSKYIVQSTDYNDAFNIPVLTAGQTFILGYTDETYGVFSAGRCNPVIIFDDFTTANHWVDFQFKVKSSAMKILKPKEDVNLRYCYHYMQTIMFNTTEHKRAWISRYSQLKIPLPPLPVQEYIVSILDKFDALTYDVLQGLPREIELRQKQYEYYRERLLDFSK